MRYVITAVLALTFCFPAFAGILKGAAQDVAFAAKVSSYPVRHPKKTFHGAKKGAKAVVKTAAKF